MITPPISTGLQALLAALDPLGVNWALTGSASFALQGLPYSPRDIDVQTDAEGAYRIEAALREYRAAPVALRESERVRSHFGALRLEGVTVELMGDLQHRAAEGGWEPPIPLAAARRQVRWGEWWVPVLAVEHEALSYAKMGRAEKAAALHAWAQAHPSGRVEAITNFQPYGERLLTGGQPLPAQIAAAARAGCRVMVNLAPSDSFYALPGEAELAAQNGLEYVHIPVNWRDPRPEDARRFFAAMDASREKKVLVHCVLNFRASALVYLYRRLALGVSEEQARAELERAWRPNEIWERFLQEQMRKG